jgi:putative ABC transport system permease protein
MGDWFQDVRYGLRGMARKPVFTATVLVTLAVGIGLNTCIFNILHTILLEELPFRDPDRLVSVWTVLPDKLAAVVGTKRSISSYPNFEDWKAENQVFEGMSAVSLFRRLTANGTSGPEQVESAQVCADFFSLLGVQPIIGRAFLKEEHTEGKDQVVIVSHRYWRSRLGSDKEILGRTILLDRKPHTVVGVLPDSFRFGLTHGRHTDAEPDLWLPRFRGVDDVHRASSSLYPLARLKPGVTLEQARVHMTLLASRLAKQYPDTNKGYGADVTSLRDTLRGKHRALLVVLMSAAGMVLLIGCANVANLFLNRAIAREKEFALRSSLGASRARLTLQLLSEGLLYAVIGGGLGLGVATWGCMIANPILGQFVRGLPDLRIHLPVLAFNVTVSVLTAILFSLAPLVQISRLRLNEQLKEVGKSASRGATRKTMTSFCVVAQLALALVLLIGASLLGRSFIHLWTLQPGFRPEGLIVVQVSLTSEGYETVAQRRSFYDSLLDRIRSLPGVETASLSSHAPHARKGGSWSFRLAPGISGLQESNRSEIPTADYQFVSNDYFRTARIPLKRGRVFTTADTQSSPPVIVINETMARRYWHGRDPIGQKIYLGPRTDRGLTVVGVVGDVRQRGMQEEIVPHMYWPHAQNSPYQSYYVLCRAKVKPDALLGVIQEQVRKIDPSEYTRISVLENDLYASIESPRLVLTLFGLFALVALALSLLGVYGVISYVVSESTRAIGIRLALGATRARVLTEVLGYGFRHLISGVVVGLAMAAGLTRLLSSQLFEVTPADPLIFSSVPVILAVFGLMACYFPARRAASVDPVRTLRAE